MKILRCYFKCLESSHEPVLLEDGVEVCFGRGPLTKIKDSRCSRTQLTLKADYSKGVVELTQIGRNSCGLNGMALKKDLSVTTHNGDKVEILLGQYPHVIEMEYETPGKEAEKEVTSMSLEKPESASNISVEDQNSDADEPAAKKTRRSDPNTGRWESIDGGKLLVYTKDSPKPSKLIAAYDLDGTIIVTKSGSVLPKNINDWKILNKKVLTKLKEIHADSYKILIFTNQAGLSTGRQSRNDFKRKIENVVKEINLPMQVFIAAGYSVYRKPAIGMWKAAMQRNDDLELDMSKSFYCGDAAGREVGGYVTKKDYSHCDLLFAKNIGLNFATPEHHFLNKPMIPLKITVFDPKEIPNDVPLLEPSWGQVTSNRLEAVMLVGLPGSGKTHFAKTHMIPAGYVHVNRDTLKTWQKCANAVLGALASKQNVVIDSTNPDVESRKKYIDLVKQYTPSVRCFIMKTSIQHSRHNNKFRQLTDPASAVGDVVLNNYMTKYQEPTVAEGFLEILKVNFWLTFKNPEEENLYKLFLLEN